MDTTEMDGLERAVLVDPDDVEHGPANRPLHRHPAVIGGEVLAVAGLVAAERLRARRVRARFMRRHPRHSLRGRKPS